MFFTLYEIFSAARRRGLREILLHVSDCYFRAHSRRLHGVEIPFIIGIRCGCYRARLQGHAEREWGAVERSFVDTWGRTIFSFI